MTAIFTTQTLTEEQRHGVANALTAAARRWDEWADELALPEVGQAFRKQAQEATAWASIFMTADSVEVRHEL